MRGTVRNRSYRSPRATRENISWQKFRKHPKASSSPSRCIRARPAARLAQEAQNFSSDIQIQSDNGTADAKSMLDILSLAISTGCTLTLLARGDDAREALTALADYLENLQD